MSDHELLARLTTNPKIMVGKPVIRGTRLTVEFVLSLLGHGATVAEITHEYQGITAEDIAACALYASRALANVVDLPLVAEAA